MTFPSVREIDMDHSEAKDREIEAKEEIIRIQAEEITSLNARLLEAHLALEDAVSLDLSYEQIARALGGRVHGGARA